MLGITDIVVAFRWLGHGCLALIRFLVAHA
jgi:hypothetical protein